jgi:hypothetical protein
MAEPVVPVRNSWDRPGVGVDPEAVGAGPHCPGEAVGLGEAHGLHNVGHTNRLRDHCWLRSMLPFQTLASYNAAKVKSTWRGA